MQGRTPALQNLGKGLLQMEVSFPDANSHEVISEDSFALTGFKASKEFLSSKSCDVQLFSGINGELCHFRARRREEGRQIEATLSQNRCNGEELK